MSEGVKMSNTQRLVFSILEFLNSEIKSNSVSEDDCESLEVVIECLERVYHLSLTNPSDVSKFHCEKPLKDIYEQAPKNAPGSPTDEAKAEAEKLKSQGNELMKEGKYTEAINSYSKAAEHDWTNAVYLCNRAAAYSKIGKHEEAIKDCEKALTLDHNYGKAYGRMGAAYMALEKYKDARDCYVKAIELDPNSGLYHNNLKTAEDKLNESTESSSQPPGGANILNSLFSNPGIMNMAQQFMANPQMQQMMSSMMGGFGGMTSDSQPGTGEHASSGTTPGGTTTGGTTPESDPPGGGAAGASNIFQFATQMAEQLQQTNPDLVNNLRETMQHMSGTTNRPNESSEDQSQDGKE